MKKLVQFANKLYAFYSRSPKRVAHLARYLKEMGENVFKPLKVFSVRWISTTVKAMDRIFSHWSEFVGHLSSIAEYIYDRAVDDYCLFDKKTIEDADELLAVLKNKLGLLSLVFNLDIDRRVSQESLLFQTRYTSLIGVSSRFPLLITHLDQIKAGEGPILKKFLGNTLCFEDDPALGAQGVQCRDIQHYEESFVRYFDTDLFDNEDFEKLSDFKDEYIDSIKNEIDAYFMTEDQKKMRLDLTVFDVLDQKQWPFDEEEKQRFKPASIEPLAKLFGIGFDGTLQHHFNNLVNMVLVSDFYCKHRKSDQMLFWSLVLKDHGSNMYQPLKWLLSSVLVVPLGSSDAERS